MFTNHKNYQKIYWIIIYIIYIIILLEFISTVYLKTLDYIKSNENKETLLSKELSDVLSNKTIIFPTRWYTSMPNHKGDYVITDNGGFRINNELNINNKSIGFFGGSTMFSIKTSQEDTIPDLIKFDGFNSLNFGVGGYSTTTEIPTFIEAIRSYPTIKYAVFYDGVNDIARYIEMIQDGKKDSAYKDIGYLYKDAVMGAALHELKKPNYNFIIYESSFLSLINRYIVSKRIDYEINNIVFDSVAEEIIDLYFKNIEVIKKIADSNKIGVIFLFQPNLFTTKKLLSENESTWNNNHSAAPKLARLVQEKLVKDPRTQKYSFIDMTTALDNSSLELYDGDWCHLNRNGNKIMAEKIYTIIKEKFHL